MHTHTRLTALFQRLPRWAGTGKVNAIWIFLKHGTVSGSGISWAVCKPAPCTRQITMPAPHHCWLSDIRKKEELSINTECYKEYMHCKQLKCHAKKPDLLWLSVGIVDAELKSRNLPATEAVDEDGLGTNVAVNEMNTVVKEAKTFNNLQSHYSSWFPTGKAVKTQCSWLYNRLCNQLYKGLYHVNII